MDIPDVLKEFPEIYLAEGGKMNDSKSIDVKEKKILMAYRHSPISSDSFHMAEMSFKKVRLIFDFS